MLPGNMAIKNKAVIDPANAALCPEISQSPKAISTTPLAITTKSASRGSQVGT
jgi:hypothetical protein